jgi:membrane carboxypeptidase/penicillin-binding protein
VTPRELGQLGCISAEYFTEEVRRQLGKLYGEADLYGGGLSVRTTLDPQLQEYARRALMDGLVQYDHGEGFRGPVASVDISGDWGVAVNAVKPLSDVPEWTPRGGARRWATTRARIGTASRHRHRRQGGGGPRHRHCWPAPTSSG